MDVLLVFRSRAHEISGLTFNCVPRVLCDTRPSTYMPFSPSLKIEVREAYVPIYPESSICPRLQRLDLPVCTNMYMCLYIFHPSFSVPLPFREVPPLTRLENSHLSSWRSIKLSLRRAFRFFGWGGLVMSDRLGRRWRVSHLRLTRVL